MTGKNLQSGVSKISALKLLATTALLLAAGLIQAQEITFSNDRLSNAAGIRTELWLSYNPTEKINICLTEDIRQRSDAGAFLNKFDMSLTTIDGTYSVNKYFSVGLGYSFCAMYRNGNAASSYSTFWSLRHRVFANVKGKISAGNFTFSLREQLRGIFNTDEFTDFRATPKNTLELRSLLTIDYDTKRPVCPYIAIEMYNPLNPNEYQKAAGAWINTMEYYVGMKWAVDSHNTIMVYYLLEHCLSKAVSIDDEAQTVNVAQENAIIHTLAICWGYSF